MFSLRILNKAFKFISMGYLLLSSRISFAASQSSYGSAADFVCGDIPHPYQPCSEDFDLIQGQATTATTLWLLGEYHSHRENSEMCLSKLTEKVNEHIVYVESTESGKEVACKDKGVGEKKGRKCIGWDDMTEKAKIEKLSLVGQELYPRIIKNIQNSRKTNMADEDFDKILSSKQKEYRQIEKNDKTLSEGNLRQIRALIRVWDLLLGLRKNGHSYKDIFAKKMYDSLYVVSPSELKIYKEAQKARNIKMIHTLSKTPKGIFSVLLTGRSHIAEEEPNDIGSAKYVQEELQKGKHQNYYAVLAMKNA